MKHALILATALALAAPAFATTLTQAEKLNQLAAGKTTAAQAVTLLGKPSQENRSPDGRFSYMYEFDLPNKADPAQPSAQGVAALMFSKAGVFEGAKLFKKSDAPAGR